MQPSKKYQITSPLGSNRRRKFGSLYLVSNKVTNEKGVLKVVQKTEKSRIAYERLQAEATFNFDSQGLPKILDTFESDEDYMIVRNYIEAVTLDERFSQIKKRERHSFLIEVLSKLGDILSYLHKDAIYHCDIKPGNILVDSNNNVHLIDFGLALNGTEITNRKLLFPLGYAAPELLLNQLSLVDHRTDYFALGITIWRLYDGKMPLIHRNPSITTNLQLTHPLPDSSEISRRIYKVLAKMCAKHSFKVPPNSMATKDVQKHLKDAMNKRYNVYSIFLSDFQEARSRGLFTKKYRDGNLS